MRKIANSPEIEIEIIHDRLAKECKPKCYYEKLAEQEKKSAELNREVSPEERRTNMIKRIVKLEKLKGEG